MPDVKYRKWTAKIAADTRKVRRERTGMGTRFDHNTREGSYNIRIYPIPANLYHPYLRGFGLAIPWHVFQKGALPCFDDRGTAFRCVVDEPEDLNDDESQICTIDDCPSCRTAARLSMSAASADINTLRELQVSMKYCGIGALDDDDPEDHELKIIPFPASVWEVFEEWAEDEEKAAFIDPRRGCPVEFTRSVKNKKTTYNIAINWRRDTPLPADWADRVERMWPLLLREVPPNPPQDLFRKFKAITNPPRHEELPDRSGSSARRLTHKEDDDEKPKGRSRGRSRSRSRGRSRGRSRSKRTAGSDAKTDKKYTGKSW